MSQSRKIILLLAALAAVFYTPYIALIIRYGHVPDDFFHFPATEATPKEKFNWLVITITSILFAAFFLLVLFPRLFGFKKNQQHNPPSGIPDKKKKLPIWFWIGLVAWSAVLILFIGRFSQPRWIINWALLPLWWGFILMLDGIVFRRNGGKSLVKNAPAELIAMGVLSISGWLIFEYFNFFIELNWFYPAAHETRMDHDEFLLYAVIGSSAFIPMAFEWYQLLRTFPAMNSRYRYGKRIAASKTTKIVLLVIAFALLFGVTFKPESLFYVVWLSPLTIMVIALSMLGIWTPFTPIKEKGDWTSLIIYAFVWVLQGLCVECWNFLSFDHSPFIATNNPGYWDYCIPYVNFWPIFNMPFLGYLGYAPFSIYCCIWVITMSVLMNIKFPFSLDEKLR